MVNTAMMTLPTATMMTPTPHGSPEWHAQRRLGIGGSDASAILGLNPYRSAFDVWAEKTGRVLLDEASPSEAAYWGTTLEGILADELESRLRAELDPGIYLVSQASTLQHCKRRWQLANVDRFVFDEYSDRSPAGLAEIKTVGLRGASDWSEPDGIGKHALIQSVHYMSVTGLDNVFVGCLVGGQRFVWRVLERDATLEEHLLEQEDAFWQLVQSDTPPPIDGSEATKTVLARMYPGNGSEVELGLTGADLIAQRNKLTDTIKATEAERQAVDNALKVILGDEQVGLLHGEPAVRWTNVTTKRIDTKALRADNPEIAQKYENTSTSRRFTLA